MRGRTGETGGGGGGGGGIHYCIYMYTQYMNANVWGGGGGGGGDYCSLT